MCFNWYQKQVYLLFTYISEDFYNNINIKTMKTSTSNSLYSTPEVQVVELCVEQGFSVSPYIDEEPGMTGSLVYDEETNDIDL